MSYPSAHALTQITDRATALQVRRILDGRTLPETVERTAAWLRQCYNAPRTHEAKMHACDVLLGTHGVEYIRQGLNRHSPAFDYCNTGDPYAATLIRFADGRYRVACWGDIVERGSYT